MKKRAVSLMISYVILVAIAISLSIGVFAWLKIVSDVSPVKDCKEGTSISVADYECYTGKEFDPAGIDIILENNGRFNIDGIILAVGNDSEKSPITYLIPDNLETGGTEGQYFFPNSLKPGETITAEFSDKVRLPGTNTLQVVDFQNITVIQVQPFILDSSGKIICQEAVLTQDLGICKIK